MRTKLRDRRPNQTRNINFHSENGNVKKIVITVGFDEDGNPKEVFCADFKAGTSLHAIVMDACILLSRLLQYDDLPSDLLASMCSPPSLIGAIAGALADCRGPITRRGEAEGASPPQGLLVPHTAELAAF